MCKNRIVVLLTLVMTITVSAGLGYFIGSIAGYNRAIAGGIIGLDWYTWKQCDDLFVDSTGIIRRVDESGIGGLIDAVEFKYDILDTFLHSLQPHLTRDDEKDRIARALEAWKTARKKLEELRASHGTRGDPNTPRSVPGGN
jgi:hypothetical protein